METMQGTETHIASPDVGEGDRLAALELRRRLVNFLRTCGAQRPENLAVTIRNGRVLLKGHLESVEMRVLCVDTCRRLQPALRILDAIECAGS